MHIHDWYSHPANRRRANRVSGAGTVVAAISAGLIAGLSQHTNAEPASIPRHITDASLASSVTDDTDNPPRPAPSGPPRSVEPTPPTGPALPAAPAATAAPTPTAAQVAPVQPAGSPRAAAGDQSQILPPQPAPTSARLGTPESTATIGGTPGFHPYVHNGPTGTATQTTSDPHEITTITTTPATNPSAPRASERAQRRVDQLTPIAVAPATGAREHNQRKNPAPTSEHDPDHRGTDGDNPGQDHATGTTPDTTVGTAGGPTGVSAYNPPAATTAPSLAQDPAARDRIARALPPGFAPAPAVVPTSPSGSQAAPAVGTPTTPVSGTQAGPPTTATAVTGSEDVPRSGGQSQSAQPDSAASPSGALTQVACPAAVANATCYQQAPTSTGSLSPGVETSGGAPAATAPAAPIPTSVNTARPAAPVTTGTSQLPAPARSTSSGDCQSSGNHTDLASGARSWSELSQLISDRIQDCLDQGFANAGSGWNNASGSSTTTSKASGGKSKGQKSSDTKSSGSTKKSSPDSPDSDSSSGSKKQNHKD